MNKRRSYTLEMLEDVFAAAPCGVSVFDEASRKTLFTNDAYFALVGYSRAEYAELIGDDYQRLLFEADKGVADLNDVSFAQNGFIPDREYRIVRHDGGIRWIRMNASQIVVASRSCALCFFEDITEQKEQLSRMAVIAESIGSSISLMRIKDGVEELLYANAMFYQLIGVSRKDYRQDMRVSSMGYVSDEDKQRTADAIRRSLTTGRPVELEYRFLGKGRRPRWMSRRLSTMKLDGPDTFLLASIVTDVTDRKKAERQLLAERDRYQTVMDNIPCGLVKVRVERDGSSGPVFVNQTFLKMTDMPREKMMELYKNDSCAGIHPDDVERIRKMMLDFRPGENRTAVFRLRKGDRGWVWVRITSYIKEENGVLMLYNSYLDVDDEIENDFMKDSLLNELPGGVAVFKVAENFECLYFNDSFSELSNRTREELSDVLKGGSFFETIIYPPDLPRFTEEIRKQAAVGNEINFSFRFFTKGGELKWLHLTARKMREDDGLPVYYCMLTYPTGEALLYRNIVKNSTTAVLVAECDTHRITFVNDEMNRLYHLKPGVSPSDRLSPGAATGEPLFLSGEEISTLSNDCYHEFHRLYVDKYLAIRAKALSWNGVDSYIMYVTDETHEYQKNLRQQELLNKVPAGIGIYQLTNGVPKRLYMNDGYYHLMRESREARESRQQDDLMKFIHPDDAHYITDMLKAVELGENEATLHHRILCGDGVYRWFRMDSMVVKRGEDGITGYCAYTDYEETIRSRQLLEQANETVKAQYEKELSQRRMLEKDSEIVAIFNITQNMLAECRSYNELLYSYAPGTVIGEVSSSILQRVPSTADRLRISEFYDPQNIAKWFRSGVTERKALYRSRQKDGCLHWVSVICRTEFNKDTAELLAHMFVRDVDFEQKKELATQSVIDEETDFVMLVNTITGVARLVRLRNDYRYLSWTQKERLDFSSLSDSAGLRHVVQEDLKAIKSLFDLDSLKKQLKSLPVVTVTYRRTLDDGSLRRKKARAFYMDETREDIVIAQRDITDLYKEEQEQKRKLEAASRAKSDFLSNMSHEIRTPMNAIIGMTELTMDGTNEPETKAGLQSIKDSGDYMMSILNDILDMSRIESGKFTLNSQWISPADVLVPCVEMIRPAMEKKHITFDVPVFDKILPYEYYVDVLKTRQMLMNLLNNACKFTGEGGHIRLSFKNKGFDGKTSTDLITIEDDGCGMSEDFLKRIFTPFAQERNSFSGSVQGTGLGLALARQTARAMGGDITVESRLGKGSSFTIEFPYRYRLRKEGPKKIDTSTVDLQEQLKNRRILLCEDNELNTVIASRLLEKVGCIVDTAKNGREGVEMFSASMAGTYDAVLMDIRMPEMDGLEAARAILALDRTDSRAVPIIAMSANAFEEDVKTSLNAGMNDHLAKPVEPRKMYDTLARLIRQRRG